MHGSNRIHSSKVVQIIPQMANIPNLEKKKTNKIIETVRKTI